MKVEIDGNNIRIKGELCGKDRHLKIYCCDMNGEDYYSVCVVKDGFEIGCGPAYYINQNYVIEQTALHGRRFID